MNNDYANLLINLSERYINTLLNIFNASLIKASSLITRKIIFSFYTSDLLRQK